MNEEHPERCGPAEAISLFCLARADALPCAENQVINGRSSFFLWRREAIVAVCSRAPLVEFCGPEAEQHLADLAWVGPHAHHHAEVIMNVMRHSPVLPARFGTLFSSLERLEKLMEKNHETILGFFDRVEAREEWAVKGWMIREDIRAALCASLPGAQGLPPVASPGARYLGQQRLRLAAYKEINLWVRAICQEFEAALAVHSSDFRDRPVQSVANPDHGGDMMSNWAFLVPRAERAVFRERIKKANATYRPQGVYFECSGPWPPFSFVPSLDVDPDA